jgi:hypothetical protein
MQWSKKDLSDPVGRLRRLLQHGKRWCHIYWRQTFDHKGFEVNAASVPVYLIEQIEREEATVEDVVCGLARMSSRQHTEDPYRLFPVFHGLWDEAVTYVLGVRQDVLRANAAADSALLKAEKGDWMSAFRAACVAYDIEEEHSGNAHYWHPFLYSIADVLVRLGHGRSYSDLRRRTKATA